MNELRAIQIIATTIYNYANHTQKKMTYQDEAIAELNFACERLKNVNKLSIQYINQFFEEREITRDTVMTALDVAIQSKDTVIADMALELLDNEYKKNPIRELRRIREG